MVDPVFPSGILARPMGFVDIPQVAGIESVSFQNPWPAEFFGRCLRAGCMAWVLEQDSRVAAYAVLQVDHYGAHLLNLCVRPESRRQGLGKSLLEFLVDLLRKESRIMVLEVRASNLAAISLYQQLGFRQIGSRKNYYRDPASSEDALVFACDLRGT